jgi:hypothetical protein
MRIPTFAGTLSCEIIDWIYEHLSIGLWFGKGIGIRLDYDAPGDEINWG